MWKYESDKNFDLKATYKFSVKSGKGKVILISPDNKITTLLEIKDKEDKNILTIPIKKGSNRIKLV